MSALSARERIELFFAEHPEFHAAMLSLEVGLEVPFDSWLYLQLVELEREELQDKLDAKVSEVWMARRFVLEDDMRRRAMGQASGDLAAPTQDAQPGGGTPAAAAQQSAASAKLSGDQTHHVREPAPAELNSAGQSGHSGAAVSTDAKGLPLWTRREAASAEAAVIANMLRSDQAHATAERNASGDGRSNESTRAGGDAQADSADVEGKRQNKSAAGAVGDDAWRSDGGRREARCVRIGGRGMTQATLAEDGGARGRSRPGVGPGKPGLAGVAVAPMRRRCVGVNRGPPHRRRMNA